MLPEELRKSMLLFEERTMTDERKAQRKNIKAFAVKEKLDIKLFDTNIKIYHVKHPDTKDPCVLCVVNNINEAKMVAVCIPGDEDAIIDGIRVVLLYTRDTDDIKRYLEA